MKKYFLLVAILFSANAMASKARVQSLLGANHLVDTQTVFTVPSHLLLLNPYLTFEMGAAGTGAEGGIARNVGAGKLLVYLGHQNTTESAFYQDARAAGSYVEQRNPIEVVYGTGNMGFGVSLSHGEDQNAGNKETSAVLKWGMNMNNESWVYAHVHAWDASEKRDGGATDHLDVMPYITLGGAMASGSLRYFGELSYGKWTSKDGSANTENDITDMDITVGVEDRSLKTDAADIYYGVKVTHAKRDTDGAAGAAGSEITGYKLPAFIGIEIPVVSWATFRGSVQQNILAGQTKNTTAATNRREDSIAADTVVAAGLGLKWNNLVLDGALTAAGSGDINGNAFMSQASVTYNF